MNKKVGGGRRSTSLFLCLWKEERRKRIINYILYFALVFTSNFGITIFTRYTDTSNGSMKYGLLGNSIYEFANVSSLYLGIKNLPYKQMIILHLLSANIGYWLGNVFCEIILK